MFNRDWCIGKVRIMDVNVTLQYSRYVLIAANTIIALHCHLLITTGLAVYLKFGAMSEARPKLRCTPGLPQN